MTNTVLTTKNLALYPTAGALALQTSEALSDAHADLELVVTQTLLPAAHPLAARGYFTAADLLAMKLPELNYTVPNIIPEGLVTLIGKSKLGKSWLCLQLALAVSRGESFLGETVEQGAVLYLALEDQPRRLLDRLNLMQPDQEWNEIGFMTSIPDIFNGGLEVIETWLRSTPNAPLVIGDVLQKLLPHDLKDDYQGMTRALSALQALAFKYNVTFLVVHHAKKGESQSGDPYDQILGSTAIMSNSDATLLLERGRREQTGQMHLIGRDVEERLIDLRRDNVRWELSTSSTEPALSSAQQVIVDAIATGHHTPAQIRASTGKEHSAIMMMLKKLIEDGIVRKSDRGRYELVASKVETTETAETQSAEPADMTDISDIALLEDAPDSSEYIFTALV